MLESFTYVLIFIFIGKNFTIKKINAFNLYNSLKFKTSPQWFPSSLSSSTSLWLFETEANVKALLWFLLVK